MTKKFNCHCNFHIIKVDTRPLNKEAYISIDVFEHKSMNTGKLLKKPKCLGGIVLIGKEAKKFYSYIEGANHGLQK